MLNAKPVRLFMYRKIRCEMNSGQEKAKAKLVELDKRVTSYAVGGIMCALIAVGSLSESFSKFSDASHSSNQARRVEQAMQTSTAENLVAQYNQVRERGSLDTLKAFGFGFLGLVSGCGALGCGVAVSRTRGKQR